MSSSAGISTRRGQYTSRACSECRRRRCRCDGIQPVCGTCTQYGRECEWSTDTDARRPITRQLVASLRLKIRVLETEIEQLRPGSDSGVGRDQNNSFPESSTCLDQFSLGTAPGVTSWARPTQYSHQPRGTTEPAKDTILDRSAPASHLALTATYRYIFHITSASPVHELHRDSQLSLHCDWSRYLPRLPNASLSRIEHDTLLLRFFKYGTSWLLCLVPELFLRDMLYSLTSETCLTTSEPRLDHYSSLLHCAVMAYATAFSDDATIRAPETRAAFADAAKWSLDLEFRRPGMSLVCALVLLADYYCGIGESEMGYMYTGMAVRAARVRDSTSAANANTNEETSIALPSVTRDWQFWSIFCHDKLMAMEYNRGYDIPNPTESMSLPSIDSGLDDQPWTSELPGIVPAAGPKLTTLALFESSRLMTIATRIIDIIGCQSESRPNIHMIMDTHLSLDTWFNNLPESLMVWTRSSSPLSHVIVMHICYWWLLILLHIPLYRTLKEKDKEKVAEEGREPHMPSGELSVKICDRATRKIIQLLKLFDDQHGLRVFPRSMTEAVCACGSGLLLEHASAPIAAHKKRSNAVEGVQWCIKALLIMSPTWPVAQIKAKTLQLRLEEQTIATYRILEDDGLSTSETQIDTVVGMEAELDDVTDLSATFYQYMNEWGCLPGAQLYVGPMVDLEPLYSQPVNTFWGGA